MEILTTLLLILLFLFHLAILPGLIWDIYLKPCNSDWALNPQSLFLFLAALCLHCSGLVAPKHVRSYLPIMEQTRVPCIARQILNHWIHQGSPNPMVFLLWSHTQSQDSMKPSLLMSCHRRNSVRDKVVTKK